MNAYDANAYDALWIAALTENISGNILLMKLKAKFNNIVHSYQGASGNIKLNRYGDRIGNYDFWMVKETETNDYEWGKVTEKTQECNQ